MAWTAPRTWVSGELVTAALFNTHIRDNLQAIVASTGAYVNAVTGPHAIGGSTFDYVRLGLTGAFTSGGASTVAYGTYRAQWGFSRDCRNEDQKYHRDGRDLRDDCAGMDQRTRYHRGVWHRHECSLTVCGRLTD
jgi:hypothetical protein